MLVVRFDLVSRTSVPVTAENLNIRNFFGLSENVLNDQSGFDELQYRANSAISTNSCCT